MRLIKLGFKRETAVPMLALVFASVVSVALVVARIAWTRQIVYGFLIWNLFLAWLPLAFALFAADTYREGAKQTWRFYVLTGAWLLFFPNAPYIFTDLIHLTRRFSGHFWVDLVLILLCALTGLVVGFLSMFLMQSVVTRMFGRLVSWFFIAFVAALSGVGIYVGRFMRFNSWDIVVQPISLLQEIASWVGSPVANGSSVAFSALFAIFLFIAYVMLYGLTHLQHVQPGSGVQSQAK
jgi:uncharacterized membrane protein